VIYIGNIIICTLANGCVDMTYQNTGERSLRKDTMTDSTRIVEEVEWTQDVVRIGGSHEALHKVNRGQLDHGFNDISPSNLESIPSTLGYRSGWLSGVLMALLVITVVPLVPMLCAFIAGIFINRSISNKE